MAEPRGVITVNLGDMLYSCILDSWFCNQTLYNLSFIPAQLYFLRYHCWHSGTVPVDGVYAKGQSAE